MKTLAGIALVIFVAGGILPGTRVFGWIVWPLFALAILSMARLLHLHSRGYKNHTLEVVMLGSLAVLIILLGGSVWWNL